MYKILLVEHVIPHYRKDVFEGLFKMENFDFKIIAGKDYKGIKSLKGDQYLTRDYFSCKIRKHQLFYLKGSIRFVLREKPDVIICTGLDFHQLHTLIIFFLQRFIFRKKIYWWSHGAYGTQGRFGILIRSFFYSYASGVLAYSRKSKEKLEKIGVGAHKIQVVNNSLNFEDYGYLNLNIFNKGKNQFFTILYCGRITEYKKLWLLIEALAIAYTKYNFYFKCIIIGEGETHYLKELAKKMNIEDKIEFVGAKYGAETYPYFLSSDLFVYPGGIGLSIVQALSFGLPVITTDNYKLHGPEIELLQPGFNGDFYCDNSSEDLAVKILEWSVMHLDSMDEMRRNCLQKITDLGYLPDKVVSNITEFMNKELITARIKD